MSKRYIDVESLILQLEKVQFDIENSIYSKGFGAATETMLGILRKYPTADVAEVRHGHNKLFDYPSLFECSICGAFDDDTLTGNGEYKYCPWCGAKMGDGTRDIDAFIEQIESCSYTVIKDTADVVEVVRCKDCKHYGGITFGGVCRKYSGCDTKVYTDKDHYCSYGERRKNDATEMV